MTANSDQRAIPTPISVAIGLIILVLMEAVIAMTGVAIRNGEVFEGVCTGLTAVLLLRSFKRVLWSL